MKKISRDFKGANESKWGGAYKPLIIIYFGLLLLLGITFEASIIFNISIEQFTADPATTHQIHPLTGFISHIGIIFWCASASFCLFTYTLLTKEKGAYHNDSLPAFLLSSGILSLLLLADDLFLMHEFLIPKYLNLSQLVVYLGYAAIISGYLFYFRETILNNDFYILLIAFALLGLSVVIDVFLPQEGVTYFIEDSLKLLGIATWAVYFFQICFSQIRVRQLGNYKPLSH